jgi:DNA-binding transcriptional LysR family regulator
MGRLGSCTEPTDETPVRLGREKRSYINLRHLRHFVAVAEELHFARAAARLNMAQPPLSQQIQRLECDLQVRLLDRRGRKIKLTEAGSVFLSDARRILNEIERARHMAQRASRGQLGQLAIGIMSNGNRDLFAAVLPRFREQHRDVNVVVHSMNTAAQIEALRNGQIDIGILRLPINAEDLDVAVIACEELLVALPTGHKLARVKKVFFTDVAQCPQVMFARRLAPAYYDLMIERIRRDNPLLEVVQEVEHVPTQLGLASCGYGVALLPASVRAIRYPNIVYRAISDADFQVISGIAHLRSSTSGIISAFKATFGSLVSSRDYCGYRKPHQQPSSKGIG